MKLYFFVKQNGNCEIRGVEVETLPEAVVALQTELTNAGFELSDPSEYVSQIIMAERNAPPMPEATPEVAPETTEETASV